MTRAEGQTGVWALLRSSRLTLLLLLMLAPLAAAGTFFPAGEAEGLVIAYLGEGWIGAARFFGLVATYRSPLFILLFTLLCLNIILCTWHRTRRRLGRGGGGGRRKRRMLLDAALHLSIPAILLGGVIKASVGFIGTQYLFVDTPIETAFGWQAQAQVPLGFSLHLKERVEEHYPLALQVQVRRTAASSASRTVLLREGRGVTMDGRRLELNISGYDPEGDRVFILVEKGDMRREEVFDLAPEGKTSSLIGDYNITLLAWRRDLMRIRGRVAFAVHGKEVLEGWLVPNGSLTWDGTSIYQTSWGEDPYGNPYLGIQVVRDPGAPLFWAGAVILSLSLPLFVFARQRGAGRGA